MSWFLLVTAGLLEVVWAVGLRYSDGFTRPLATIITVAALVGSFALLGLAVRDLPLGTAYAIWVGIGIAGVAILGVVLFDEPLAAGRVVSLVALAAGIIGLQLTTSTH